MLQIYDSDSFAGSIAREEARRNRYGVGFSVVSISAGALGGARRVSRVMNKIVRRRLRSTDCVGWIDETSLAVLLPETDAVGAQRVAQELSERIGKAVGLRPILETKSV